MPPDPLDGEELVYRSIKNDPEWFGWSQDGRLIITVNAFDDPVGQPSVIRAALNGACPECSLRQGHVGATSLMIHHVRLDPGELGVDEHGRPSTDEMYSLDVQADPQPGEEAHALIVLDPTPARKQRAVRRRLLSRLAAKTADFWEICPVCAGITRPRVIQGN